MFLVHIVIKTSADVFRRMKYACNVSSPIETCKRVASEAYGLTLALPRATKEKPLHVIEASVISTGGVPPAVRGANFSNRKRQAPGVLRRAL